jgi:hypothetical protein
VVEFKRLLDKEVKQMLEFGLWGRRRRIYVERLVSVREIAC